MKHKGNYSLEVRERAIRMVREQRDQYNSEWAAISSIAEKFGCKAETLRLWIRQEERDSGLDRHDAGMDSTPANFTFPAERRHRLRDQSVSNGRPPRHMKDSLREGIHEQHVWNWKCHGRYHCGTVEGAR